MTNRERIDVPGDDPWLRLDIYLNPGLKDETLAALAQQAHPIPPKQLTQIELVTLASKLYHSRRIRDRYLSASMLGEPVWDMLLALYCFSVRGEALSVSGLCHSAGVPQTTALRWVQLLEQKELISRSKDHKDGRRALVSLSETAKEMMDRYLTAIHADMTG